MYSDMVLKMLVAMETMDAETRLLCYLGLFVGMPLLCVVLLIIDKIITDKRSGKIYND